MIGEMLGGKNIKILGYLVRQRGPANVSAVSRHTNMSKSTASLHMKELEKGGVLQGRIIGRSTVYALSQSLLAKRVVKIIESEKELLADIYRAFSEEAKPMKPLSMAVFGSALKGLKPASDIDFLVISDRESGFYELGGKLTEKFGISISVMVMREKEFREKAKRGEEFTINVLSSHKLIYGKELERIVWPGK